MQTITPDSILEVRDSMDLADIIKRSGIDLKQRGGSMLGLCPFHDERTPSFTVNVAHGYYKCFGCGKSGDAITFVMEHDNMPFLEAVKHIAAIYNVRLETKKLDPEEEQQVSERQEMYNVNREAMGKFQNVLLQLDFHAYQSDALNALGYLNEVRGLNEEMIMKFQLGYAPNEWKFLTPMILEKELFEVAHKVGLVQKATEGDNKYDVYRHRIMFPIHDLMGNVVGFGGRTLFTKEELEIKETAKYLNSKKSPVYHKDRVLYGLNHAVKGIKDKKFAVLVEGYTDVISFHQYGATNTVATCGTALTEEHAKLLKKFTDHIVVCRDGDAAGINAKLKDINILLTHGFKVDVMNLPDGQDPDDFAKSFAIKELEEAEA